MGGRWKDTGKREKYHDKKKILQSILRQPGKPHV